jgi:diacylglycerol kinase (ATP)
LTEVLVIANPAAGRRHGAAKLRRAISLLGSARVVFTQHPGHAKTLAQEAIAQGCTTVVAAGGDGTIGQIAQVLAGSDVALGILPLGTGNDVSRHLGIGTDISKACSAIREGHTVLADLGEANGVLFLNVAGCGFDAAVAQRVNAPKRRSGGTLAYLLTVISVLRGFIPLQASIRVDDKVFFEGGLMLCSVGNCSSYGGGMRICPAAKISDTLLDITAVMACGKMEFLAALPGAYIGRHVNHRRCRIATGKRITVVTTPPSAYFADGELLGQAPLTCTIRPSCLRILAPAGFRG